MPMTGKSTGQLVGTVVGAIIGAVLAAPTGGLSVYAGLALGASIGGLAGGVAGGLYDTVNPPEVVNEQDSIADILLQTSSYGQSIPQVAGRFRLAGNVIDIGPKTEVENRESQDPGGKGGGVRQVTITKTYTVSLAIALCDTRIFGEIVGLARIWADNTIIYDNTQMATLPDGWTLYTGSSPQTPSSVFEAIHGVGNVPGYPFSAIAEVEDYNMGQNPRVPNFNFEVYQGESQQLALTQIAISPTNGDVWVAVPTQNQVWRYDESTRERLAVVQLSADAPVATPYGFSLIWESTNYLWVADPITYSARRIDPASNLVDTNISHENSFIGNQVESGGYLWLGTLQYAQVVLNDQYVGHLGAYDEAGLGPAGTQSFEAVRSWLRLAKGADGNIWSFSDQDDGNQSTAIRINHTNANQIATINLGVNDRITDVVMDASGDPWYCNYTDGTIVHIDAGTNTIDTTVTVGAQPVQAGLASDNYIWVACADRTVHRIHPTTHAVQSFQSDTPHVISPNNNIWAQGPSGAMWVVCTDDWTVQRFATTGTVITVRTGASPRAIAAGASSTVWVCCASGDLHQITDAGVTNDPTSAGTSRLQQVVGKLCEASGLTSSDYDVTALDNAQVMAAIVNIVATRAPLEHLALAHNFALVESNRKLVFKRRGQEAIAAVIPEADLDASEQTGETPGLAITRAQESELPTTLSFNYTSPTRNYQQNTQMAFVSNSQLPTENGRVVSTTIGLSDLEAKQRAQELLDRIWVERNGYAFKVGRKYAYLEPMDRIQVTSRSVTHTLTIVEATYGRPGVMEIQGRSDSASTQYVIGAIAGVVTVGGQQIGYLAHTTARLLNLPALGNADQVARYHVAYEYAAIGWPGATLHRSPDAGTSYSLKHIGIIKGITGSVATGLVTADWHFLDETSTFTVVLASGTLTSISDTQLYNGGNAAMLGDELVQFGIATLVSAGTYTCSRLLRGRRGTEWAVDSHGSNEQFAMVDAGAYKVEHDLAERNAEVPFKCVTTGIVISTVTAVDFTPTDENLRLWELFPETEQDGADWVFTWLGRARFNSVWNNGPDVDFRHYRLEIYDDNTYTTIVRTVDQDQTSDFQADQEYRYEEADQILDFGSAQATLYYRLFAVGSYGAGRYEDLVTS